ncbi:MAG TPA: OST-HTH/LOTUS domain-containing protein, partial [Vicinamibacterales bacterium]|nr:OST-HTH/LOTUS domain-containing protein [Vicinamibacterales bacterium]
GDSDFLSLVEKLKQYDKKVFVVGGRAFTSMILQRNCHEFIAYENLAGVRKAAAKQGRPMPAAAASVPIAQALPVVRRALKILADREVTPQTGLLKSTLLQLDSTFSERNYGASSFLDFVEKLAASGFVHLKTSGRSVMVELNPGYTEETRPVAEGEDAGAVSSPAAHLESGAALAPMVAQPQSSTGSGGSGQPHSFTGYAGSGQPPSHGYGEPRRSSHEQQAIGGGEPVGPPLGDQAEGVRRAGQILGGATGARWPMYLRNVKQILRQTEGGFDERRYGFGGLMDLLKGCQREGLVRVERDRRGGLRVFQGSALQGAPAAPAVSRPNLPQPDVEEYENQPVETRQPDVHPAAEPAEGEGEISEPIPIDTTAELLGRAKPRQPRVRAARPAPVAAARKAAARKPVAKKPARGKKSRSDDTAGNR